MRCDSSTPSRETTPRYSARQPRMLRRHELGRGGEQGLDVGVPFEQHGVEALGVELIDRALHERDLRLIHA